MQGAHNMLQVDLAFARFAETDLRRGASDWVHSTFYMPIANAHPSYDSEATHRLQDATEVVLGDMVFCNFVGAKRD